MIIFDRKNRIFVALLILFAAIILYVNSPLSPIRDISYLDYDSTVFYIMGKGIKYNYIPYVDLTDHKGIYIFLLNYLGVLICESHNLGIFVVQFLVVCLSIIAVYKLSFYITKDSIVSFLSTFTIIVLQNSYYFSQGGLKCETFLMPFIFFALYLFIKEDWKYTVFSRSMFLMGICAGIVMMTKTNMLFCFIPIIIYHIYYLFIDRNIKKILALFISGLLGVIIGIAPAIVYCLANNNFNEMIYNTFQVNFTYLNDLQFYYRSYLEAISRLAYRFLPIIIASGLSVIAFYKLLQKKCLLLFYVPFVIFNLYAVFMALRPHDYYASILLPCIFFDIVFIYVVLKKFIVDRNKYLKIIYVAILILLFTISYHISWKRIEADQIGMYVVAKRIHKLYSDVIKSDDTYSDTSLLVVGSCINIYNELNILPNIRYFCTPHISRKMYSEPYDEILKNINEKKSRFVALSFTKLMIKDGFNEEVRAALKEGYTYVDDVFGFDAELYKRK